MINNNFELSHATDLNLDACAVTLTGQSIEHKKNKKKKEMCSVVTGDVTILAPYSDVYQ